MTRYASVPDFPGYRIGDDGSTWSCVYLRKRPGQRAGFESYLDESRWKRLADSKDADGYRILKASRGGQQFYLKVHRLVLEVFVGPKPAGDYEACHENGVRHDNRVCNLRWDTPAGNSRDADRHGTIQRGEKHVGSKLTDEQVVEIISRRSNGETYAAIAADFGITYQHAANICYGKRWRHVHRA